MELDIAFHKGRKDKPSVILILGFGMDKGIWVDSMSMKIFAGNIPLKILASLESKTL